MSASYKIIKAEFGPSAWAQIDDVSVQSSLGALGGRITLSVDNGNAAGMAVDNFMVGLFWFTDWGGDAWRVRFV